MHIDKEKQQELAYYELHVKYPFIVDNMTASDPGDFTKVGDAISLSSFIVKGTPGVTDEVIYRIPREYFVQKDGVGVFYENSSGLRQGNISVRAVEQLDTEFFL